MAPAGSQSSWKDEDESVVLKESLHQKEMMTAQMIGIISTRLNSLQTVANNRKFGLDCDLRVHSDYCSKMVPGLPDPYENRVGTSGKVKPTSSTSVASSQAMMERLFGPDEKTRLRTVLKKNKMELQKNENRRNARVKLEKQLQASIEGHITRTVESYVHAQANSNNASGGANSESAADGSSVHVHTRLLLLHTYERMRIAYGKKNFKRFLLSDVSNALLEDVFWLTFWHNFQSKSTRLQQRALVDELSARYVKMIASLQSNIDAVFRMYPYAVASAVCWGFHYLFPGSRHLYSVDFKNGVFKFVCQLLLGLEICPVTVQAMRRQYFPDEVLEDLSVRNKQMRASASAGAIPLASGNSNSDAHLPILGTPPLHHGSMSSLDLFSGLNGSSSPSNNNNRLAKSTSESYLGRQASSDNTVDKILDLTQDCESETPLPIRSHQMRGFFNTSQLSPLMKEYFGSPTKSVKKPCFLLRTTPFDGCHVGGEATFHKHYRRKNQHHFAAEAAKEQEKCLRDVQRTQRETKREIAALQETREIVLSSGKKALQAYCTMLLSHKSMGDDDDSCNLPSSGNSNNATAATTISASERARRAQEEASRHH